MQAYIVSGDQIETTTSADTVREAHAAGRRIWVDLDQRSPASDKLLAETFQLHPLVIEDIWFDRTTPKIDDYDGYVYLAVHGPRRAPEGARAGLELWVLDIVFGATFVISQHTDPALGQAIAAAIARSKSPLLAGSAWVVHALLDHVVDRYLALTEIFEKRIDQLEGEVIAAEGVDELPAIFSVKRSIEELCRITQRQLRLLERLAVGEFDQVPKAAIPYFRDVYEHFARVADRAEIHGDVIANVLEVYLGVQSNRMNQTIKTLTLISTVMLPLNVIAGIYGMNFHRMPELSWKYGYPVTLGVMATVATAILVFFRRKRWW